MATWKWLLVMAVVFVAGACSLLVAMMALEKAGWQSPNVAQEMAARQVREAVVAEVTPYCVARFIHLPDAPKQWKGFREAAKSGDDFIRRLGLTKVPGAAKDSPFAAEIARACAERVRILTEVDIADDRSYILQLIDPFIKAVTQHLTQDFVTFLHTLL